MSNMGKRFYWVDNIKALLILLVVIGHFADTYIKATYFKGIYVFIYAFHMPLFIFISGLLFKNEDVLRKISVYFVLGYALKFIDYVTLYCLGKNPRFEFWSEDGAPWYLFAMAAYMGMNCLFQKIDFEIKFALAVILGCFSGYYSFIGDRFILSRIIVFYPYFLLGCKVAEKGIIQERPRVEKIKNSPVAKYVAAGILIIWAFLCFGYTDAVYPYRRLFTGRNPFGEVFAEFGCFNRLFCYIIAVILGMAIVVLIPDKPLAVVSVLGTRTLQIFFWHWPILFVLQEFLPVSKICSTLSGQMLYIFGAFVMTFVLALPVFGYPLNKVIGYRHKIKE